MIATVAGASDTAPKVRRAQWWVVPPGGDGHGDIGFVDAIPRLHHDSNGRQAQAGHDPGVRNFPGGIVRFSLGGHRDGS